MQSKLLTKTLLAFAFCVFLLGAFSVEAQIKQANNKSTGQMSDKIIYEPDADLLREMREKVTIVESEQNWARLNRQRPIISPNKTRKVYIAQFETEEGGADNLTDVIVIYNEESGEFYEIRGFDDFQHRPFDQIRWIGNDILQFDQWVNPNNGGRYRVNLRTGEVVAAGYVRSR